MIAMSKTVSIGAKPTNSRSTAPAAAGDAWVEKRDPEPMKRLTIDIPAALHRAIKTKTAARGTKIAEEVRVLLEREYGD